jgi:5-methylcytosine-specific restriction protein B
LLLKKINERIEYLYDRDHTIGHAYFMDIKDPNKQNLETLSNIFRNKIIPLLQEYFYDDWEKIRLVLGDNQKTGENEKYQFIKIKSGYKINELFGNNIGDIDIQDDRKVYEINDDAFEETESYIKIYETK